MLFISTPVVVSLASAAATLFVILKGDRPERCGAVWMMLFLMAPEILSYFLPNKDQTLPLLVTDAVYGIGFFVMAIRFISLPLGVAMLAQAVQFASYASIVMQEQAPGVAFWIINNACYYVILATLVVATIMSLRRRAARRATASLATPSQSSV